MNIYVWEGSVSVNGEALNLTSSFIWLQVPGSSHPLPPTPTHLPPRLAPHGGG